MKITYLDRSGFMAVVPGEVILVFDFYRDPAHAVLKALKEHQELPVVFFVSSKDAMRFNSDIFNMAQDHKRLYFISDDVFSREVRDDLPVNWMTAGDSVTDQLGGLGVRAYSAGRDHGVSYAVTTASGKKIFHAGSLVHTAESHTDGRTFETVINRVAATDPEFDVAFVPLDTVGDDPASEERAAYLLDTIRVANFFPMPDAHSHHDGCDISRLDLDKKVSTRFFCLQTTGKSVDLDI